MERKFKVGDRVKTDEDKTGVIVFIDNKPITGKIMPYVIDLSENGSDWCCKKESDLTLISSAHRTYTQEEVDKIASDVMNLGMKVRQDQLNGVASGKSGAEELKEFLKGYYTHEPTPNPRYKEGDEVWHITEKRRYLFYCYTGTDYCHLSLGVNKYTRYTRSLSDIEPYTGQDKVVAEPEKPTHPFAVILKSGVKIGIDEKRAKQLNVDIINGVTSTSIVENKIEVSGVYFKITQIAAIVPTENLT